MVESELAFWKKTAPGLKPGWWNNMQDKRVGLLRQRYGFVLQIFYALKRLKSPGCEKAVAEFRDYWRSLPQLEDKNGLERVTAPLSVAVKVVCCLQSQRLSLPFNQG